MNYRTQIQNHEKKKWHQQKYERKKQKKIKKNGG
jgi:hypothetical protein